MKNVGVQSHPCNALDGVYHVQLLSFDIFQKSLI